MSTPKRAGKVKDKWRLKTWFSVHAPSYFGGAEIAEVPALDDNHIKGRIVEVTLYDLTKQDIQQMNTKTYFQVIATQGNKAETIFKGHEYAREYLRSLIRRGSSRVDAIFPVKSRDGYQIRVSGVVFSAKLLKPSQETGLRKIMNETVAERAGALNFNELVQELVLAKVASDIYNKAKKIAPLRHVGIRKTKLLAIPKEEVKTEVIASAA